MSDDGNIFQSLGFNIPNIVAGLCGGIVNALFFRQSSAASVIAAIFGGGLTANYIGAPFAHVTGGMISVETGSFVVGLTAMIVCQKIVEAIAKLNINKKGMSNGNGG